MKNFLTKLKTVLIKSKMYLNIFFFAYLTGQEIYRSFQHQLPLFLHIIVLAGTAVFLYNMINAFVNTEEKK